MFRTYRAPVAIVAAVAAIAVPAAVEAHRAWILPSATVLSGNDAWVTFDAAVANELFYFDHQPLRGDFTATAPDGSTVAVENQTTGRYRTSFDLHLTQQGTYRIASVRDGVMGSYMLNGERQRLPRGLSAAAAQAAIPAGATDVQIMETSARTEAFVTLGEPTTANLAPTGRGIELVPVTHPNDLYAGEAATFQFLLDGQPLANQNLTILPGGSRYRDHTAEITATTDAEGKVTITWPEAGMYWLSINNGPAREGGEGPGQQPPEPASGRRASYVAVLEVLPA